MTQTLDVHLRLHVDDPRTLTFEDIDAGLVSPWYRVRGDATGGVELWGNPEGLEWLARYLLKLARTPKVRGFHDHLALEFSSLPSAGEPEFTIGLAIPEDFVPEEPQGSSATS